MRKGLQSDTIPERQEGIGLWNRREGVAAGINHEEVESDRHESRCDQKEAKGTGETHMGRRLGRWRSLSQ